MAKHDEEQYEPKLDVEGYLETILKSLRQMNEILLDLQTRQITMETRQKAIRQDFEESSASEKKGSFATGYQKKED